MASKVRKRHHRGHHGSHAVSTPKAASNSSPPPPQKTVQGASAGTAFSEGERIISALRSAQSGDKAGITYEACSHLLSEARTSLAGYINRYGQEDPLAPALLDVYRDESYAVEAWSLKLKGTRQDLDSANSVDRTILDAALRANPDLETKLSTRTDDSGAAYCMLPCQDAMDALWSKSAELLDKVSKEFPSGND